MDKLAKSFGNLGFPCAEGAGVNGGGMGSRGAGRFLDVSLTVLSVFVSYKHTSFWFIILYYVLAAKPNICLNNIYIYMYMVE